MAKFDTIHKISLDTLPIFVQELILFQFAVSNRSKHHEVLWIGLSYPTFESKRLVDSCAILKIDKLQKKRYFQVPTF